MKVTKVLCAAVVVVGILISLGAVAMAASGMKTMGTVTILKKDPVTIHSYMSPEESAFVTTQIVETKNKLVVIDVQFLRPYAQEVREYIKRLNKPIDRIIITHSHPDHWFGLEYFKDAPVYALEKVRDMVDKAGDAMIKAKREHMGDLVTSTKVVPSKTIKAGKDVIDGLEYEFEEAPTAEADIQLLVKLPTLQTLVAQDLVYNNLHLFLGQNQINGWMQIIGRLQNLQDYTTILGGHGEPADTSLYPKLLQYLKDAGEILASGSGCDDLKRKLIEKHPVYRAPFIIDLSCSYLFKK